MPFPSEGYAAVNAYGAESLALTGPLSTVEGAWFAPFAAFNGWYDPYSVHTLTIEGYAGSTLVGSTTTPLVLGFQFLEMGFTGPVDRMVFHTGASSPQWYLFDDMRLNVIPREEWREPGPGPSVPEPETWLLLGVGLAVLSACSSRFLRPA
jgi:hypothetical protein